MKVRRNWAKNNYLTTPFVALQALITLAAGWPTVPVHCTSVSMRPGGESRVGRKKVPLIIPTAAMERDLYRDSLILAHVGGPRERGGTREHGGLILVAVCRTAYTIHSAVIFPRGQRSEKSPPRSFDRLYVIGRSFGEQEKVRHWVVADDPDDDATHDRAHIVPQLLLVCSVWTLQYCTEFHH